MRAVNLLPDKAGKARRGMPSGRRPLVVAGAALAVLGVGYMAYTARSEAGDLAAQVQQAEQERGDLQVQLTALTAVDQQTAALTSRRGAVVTLATGRINWERVMRDTVTVLPEQVWLSKLAGTSPPVANPAAVISVAGGTLQPMAVPQGLHLEGFAFTQDRVAQLMARMEAVPGLGEPRLASAESVDRGSRQVIQFVIDIPVDQRAQDRPTLDVVTPGTAGATAPSAGTVEGSKVP